MEETKEKCRNVEVIDPARDSGGPVGGVPGIVASRGYVLLEEGPGGRGSVVRGEVGPDLRRRLEAMDGGGQEAVVEALNILGHHGYRVVGVATNAYNKMVWTLQTGPDNYI